MMILAWQNEADDSTVTASSEIATLPGSNVQTEHLSQKWHTAAAVKSASLTGDRGKSIKAAVAAVIGSNVGTLATLRLRLSPTAAALDSDVVFDTGTIKAAPRKALFCPGGTVLNNASTPDAPNLDITGDIEFIALVSSHNPIPASNCIVSKYLAAGNQRSWRFAVNSGGTPLIQNSPDGANGTLITMSATLNLAAVGMSSGQPIWVKANLDVNDGAGNRVAKFYYSFDYDPYARTGTWTQLGATVTTAGATSIFSGTGNVEVGSFNTGVSGNWFGYLYYVEVRNGIDGPVVLRFDPDADATVGATTFTSAHTREVWTINQSTSPKATIEYPPHANLKSGLGQLIKQVALPYLRLPGIAGNYASTPDTAANSVTGDIDIRVKARNSDWLHATAVPTFVAKWTSSGNQCSYMLFMDNGSGRLRLRYSTTGADDNIVTATAGLTFAKDSTYWIRATQDVDNGAAGNDVKFYYSSDYDPATGTGTWTQLGATVTTAGAFTRFNSTAVVEIGTDNAGVLDAWSGAVYYAEIRNGIDGAVVASFDPTRAAAGDTSLTAATGEVWTINQSGSPKAELVQPDLYFRYWKLDLSDPAAASNLQTGRVFLGPSWETDRAQYGWSIASRDPSPVMKSRGGQSFPDVLPQARVLTFTLDFATESEIFANAFALARAQGRVKDVLAIPIPDGSYVSEQSVWGLVEASEPIVNPSALVFRQKFSIEERL